MTNYVLHGKNIVHMTQGCNNLHFFYDASNKPAIVEYNGSKYAYVHNLQGDIVAILDNNGTAVVQYKYDAWGRPIGKTGSMASTLGTVQPFRYRGYVYDEETGLYYLQTRYYSPENVRFLNADVLLSTGQGLLGNNIFAYCRNNPVRRKDTFGTTEVDILDDDPDLLDDDKSIAGGKAGSGGGSGRAGGTISHVHGNSKLSTNPQHGYEIYNTRTGDVCKTGISGQKLNQNGTSPRANPQVSKLNADAGERLYDARIVQRMPNRQIALEWERENALRLWNESHSMSIHLRPRPWEDKR